MNQRKYAIKNVTTMLFTYIVTVALSFIVRLVFLKKLGSEYLGLNGVLNSILSVLAISDLGIEAVFSFLLYKPLVENNIESIKNYIKILKRVYNFVGLFIFVSGLSLLPFLYFFIGSQGKQLDYVPLIYLILLVNSASSYLFTYNRTILNANQRNYVITSITFVVSTVVSLLQIVGLFIIDSMLLYVTLLLVSTLVTNVWISRKVLSDYPFLRELPIKGEVDRESKEILIKNTVGGLSNKLGTIVVFASDNILLSIFVNLSMVGLYSNYTLIINSITSLVQKVVGTLTASIGFVSIENPNKGVGIFHKLNFNMLTISFFVAPQLFILLRPFITLWLGEKYVLSQLIVFLVVINFVIQVSRSPSLIYIDAYGLQWVQKWKSVIESILNIVFSLIGLIFFHLGLVGILLGTILSTTLFVLWYEPYIVFKYALNITGVNLFLRVFKLLIEKVWIILPIFVSYYLTKFISGQGIIYIFELGIMNFVSSAISYFILFYRKIKFKSY
ncbi:lipopolysaccharide biosynthesis protein [Leuconostoc lactis]